ncbi:hypothetical protein Sros01_72280 [Streptomyces roseochromogenus]|nr:hypothetical protein Sros01_72280 [Streptomyces roseochromogenus]
MSNAVTVWGNVPTWISAIFSSASFTVAAAVYAKNRKDKIREQAARVTLHVIEDVGYLRNDSDLPIFELVVLLKRGPEEDPAYLRGLWKMRITHSWASCSVRRLGPNEVLTVRMPSGAPEGSTIVAIGFADADGRHWNREETGRLRRMPSPWRPPLDASFWDSFEHQAPAHLVEREPIPHETAGEQA